MVKSMVCRYERFDIGFFTIKLYTNEGGWVSSRKGKEARIFPSEAAAKRFIRKHREELSTEGLEFNENFGIPSGDDLRAMPWGFFDKEDT